MKTFNVFDIKWDTEVKLPEDIIVKAENEYDIEKTVFDKYGFHLKSFDCELLSKRYPKDFDPDPKDFDPDFCEIKEDKTIDIIVTAIAEKVSKQVVSYSYRKSYGYYYIINIDNHGYAVRASNPVQAFIKLYNVKFNEGEELTFDKIKSYIEK